MAIKTHCTEAAPRGITIRRFKDGVWEDQHDVLSREIPIRIHTEHAPPKTLWAWPCNLADLALGHVLLDMGGAGRIGSVTQLAETEFDVKLGATLPPAAGNPAPIHAPVLLKAMADFMGGEGLWDDTGCFHRAGVLDPVSMQVLHRAEDIGRHNCLDRIAGWANRSNVDLSNKVMLVSARVTSSLCAKALRAGFRFIISRSAVTTASVDMATEHNATLVGFTRDKEGRFSVFVDNAGRVLA
ncbi:formate dehydrogenase accessory sulfurtransferase FdhD [Desulfovibrio mangrovi]|uniref:formate dehydrogenase accessory sulfurtransferase FdhD n=1 Tax=Desulfovibrio mangrovi TaxID=2976983 RepID=UPI002246581D|nr:formate dehydrogenase accessory sulfurtransferase FdhD [Desulfovibrio mangrovi]UZP67240.1 formate dehydrogenase accessory sulfurtransferase FdhD [Desulfovibrio mangrovi]